jgi:FkbM family methyltransferase
VTERHTSEANGSLPRAWRFLQKPWHEKAETLRIRWASLQEQWRETSSNVRMPIRLSFGAWWVPRNDNLGESLLAGTFETNEMHFVGRLLRPGMTVLDVGAHHGLYTLLASKGVGRSGRVFSFEPSPRERRALRLHLALNLCRNVKVQGLALGSSETEATLHVVQGSQTGCNSLRPPEVFSSTAPLRVRVTSLDAWLKLNGISSVNFIKLDVEGGELDVLKGASQLLERRPRPVFLVEVEDVRTIPWGYRAREILTHLSDMEYKWFSLANGAVQELDLRSNDFEGNFIACPPERRNEITEMIHHGPHS